MVKLRRGVSLVEVLLSIVLLAAVATGFLSVLLSVRKKSKSLVDNKLIMRYEARGVSATEMSKLRLTALAPEERLVYIGANIDMPSNSVSSLRHSYRMRPDLNNDGSPDPNAPVFVFLEVED